MDVLFKMPPSARAGTNLPVTDLKFTGYETNGKVGIILSAPDCVLSSDKSTTILSSAGPMKAQSGDGSFVIEGTGFVYRQDDTNATLVISNNVSTTVQKGLLAGGKTTNAAATSGTNENVRIWSDRFAYDRNANLFTYAGNVRAEDEQSPG